MRITIYANGQIMLPAKIRRRLDINPGDSLAFFYNANEIIMCKTTSVQSVLNAHSSLGKTQEYNKTPSKDNDHEPAKNKL